ncbi:disulfide bond formation protein DsbB [Pseudomonas sp. LAMO17WK12:I10]|jgi:protein dithiol:quinone oxidoreductase|uniref:disulfide bond formation protein B n=1 Tax=unclassified Pseudomonas TaxID=196821 RepID=UPI000BDB851E|nr:MULTISPECIES: disulfide bond formation protein B [unclassified Pseudomonas]PXX74788.1 disulfide bond formation protein DsbB [Pseudomonas sp. LAMO17WK12:I9]SNY17992.1 disulfide bond formation protein DsbB [Pseudomonas sp. LAMO17WK12:I10]
MSLAGSRLLFSLVFFTGALALWASFHLEFGIGLEPCLLWVAQRFFVLLLTSISLVAVLQGPQYPASALYWLLELLCSLAGVVTAGRHVLLQNIPSDQLLACLPDMPFMLGNLSWGRALQLVFTGTAQCAEVTWTLLDMSAAEWSLLFFIAVMILSAYRLARLLPWGRRRAAAT